MQSPEEIARDTIQDWYARGLTDTPLVFLVPSLTAALRAYGDERAAQERERCAQLCENITTLRAEQMGLSHYDHLTGAVCARALRALT